MTHDVWSAGDAYEAYMGRWSRPMAAAFVEWLAPRAGLRWADVGCGTGALTRAILTAAAPVAVVGVDPSVEFVETARAGIDDSRATFEVGDARSLPMPDGRVDALVSGLALNFIPEPATALAEFVRVTAPSATVAAYVWDYRDGMPMLHHFWAAAAAIDPATAESDEARRFGLCQPGPLSTLWTEAGLVDVRVQPIERAMVFADFDDFWRPFLGGAGPAPGYVASLNDDQRDVLRERLRADLPGELRFTARVFAVRGTLH